MIGRGQIVKAGDILIYSVEFGVYSENNEEIVFRREIFKTAHYTANFHGVSKILVAK